MADINGLGPTRIFDPNQEIEAPIRQMYYCLIETRKMLRRYAGHVSTEQLMAHRQTLLNQEAMLRFNIWLRTGYDIDEAYIP